MKYKLNLEIKSHSDFGASKFASEIDIYGPVVATLDSKKDIADYLRLIADQLDRRKNAPNGEAQSAPC